MVREYLYDADRFREIEIVLNSDIVNQEAMEVINSSFDFVSGPFNVIDLQSNAMQYLSRGGKKVFGIIEDFEILPRLLHRAITLMEFMISKQLMETLKKNQEKYKDFYYDFIIGSDGQLKAILGRFARK